MWLAQLEATDKNVKLRILVVMKIICDVRGEPSQKSQDFFESTHQACMRT